MDCGGGVAGMAGNAKGCGCYRSGVAVAVSIEIGGMTPGAGGAAENGGDVGPVDWILQSWWRGVAVGASVIMNCHWVVGRVAECHTGWLILDDAKSSGRVIRWGVGAWRGFIGVAVKAVDDSGVA